jgi:hypothetical protein
MDGYSDWDRKDGLPRRNSSYFEQRDLAKVRTSPTPYIALVSVIPDPPVVIRGHVPVLAWVGLALVLIVAGLLVLAAAVFS